MAESFKNQVDALTGFASTEDLALADWLTAGARYVLNAMPLSKLSRVASNTNFTNSQDAEGKRIISVLRKDANNSNRYMPCRELEPHQMGTVHDSAYMEYATTSDPAYIIHNQVINTFPESAASNDSRVVGINTDITVADSATSIDNFPDEAEYSVVLYAARNAVERLMNNLQSNNDITTAFTAVNTELDETQAICDLINTQVDTAVTELAESAVNVDSSVDTALSAMTTASGRINTAVQLANAEFDQSDALLDLGEADTEGAINTALAAITNELAETQAICDLINTQVDDAVTEIAEMKTNVDDNVDTALAAIKTSADKINAAVVLSNAEFDKAEGESAHAEAEADDGAVATALTEIHTQVDAAVALISTGSGDNAIVNKLALVETNISNAATEIGIAKAEAAEIATQTDSASGSSKFNVALDAINTAVDKFRADADDPALFGDESVYLTGDGLTKVKDALDNATNLINNNQPSATTDAFGAQALEDTEIVQSALNIAQTEQSRARVHLEEFTTAVNGLQAEINGFATEVNARATFTGAKGQAVQAYISTAQGYINEAQSNLALANGYNTAVGAYLTAAQGYASEIQAYVTTTQMFIGTATNRINVGNAYLAEANARASEVNTYASEVNSRLSHVNAQGGVVNAFLSAAQGYASEIQNKIAISQGYSNEVSTRLLQAQAKREESSARLQTGNAYLSEAQMAVNEVNSYGAEVAQRLQQVGAQGNVAANYIGAAQGYANEITSKINIASSYIQEAQARLATDNSKYQWYTQQYQMIDAQYKESLQVLGIETINQKKESKDIR